MASEKLSPLNAETAQVLIVDDESFVRNALQIYLETHGYTVSTAAEGEEALKIFTELAKAVDVVLLDLVMPGMYGMEVLRRMKELDETVQVIIATGCGSVHSAIEAMRYGAFDYITKPIVNFDEDLLKVVEGAVLARRRMLSEEKQAPEAEREGHGGDLSAPLLYYRALEELAAAACSEMPPRELALLIEEFIAKHLKADCLLLLKREAEGGRVLVARWGSLPYDVDPTRGELACEELFSQELWEEPPTDPPSWRTFSLAEGARFEGEAGHIRGCAEAMRIRLPRQLLEVEGAASEVLLLRRPAGSKAPALPGGALLSVVLALALGQKRFPQSVAPERFASVAAKRSG